MSGHNGIFFNGDHIMIAVAAQIWLFQDKTEHPVDNMIQWTKDTTSNAQKVTE